MGILITIKQKDMLIDFKGIELLIEYDNNEPEPEVNFGGGVDITGIYHNGTCVWDIFYLYIEEITEIVEDRIKD